MKIRVLVLAFAALLTALPVYAASTNACCDASACCDGNSCCQ